MELVRKGAVPLGLGSSLWGRDEGALVLSTSRHVSRSALCDLGARATRANAAPAPHVCSQGRRKVTAQREALRETHGSTPWVSSIAFPSVSIVAASAASSTAASQGSAGAVADSGVGRGEEHKLFDRAVITAKAGDGGNGSVLRVPRPALPGAARPGSGPAPGKGKATRLLQRKEKEKQRRLTQLRRDANGLAILPQGGHGGDVILVADPRCTTLLAFHSSHSAPASPQGGGAEGQEGGAKKQQPRQRRFAAGAGGNVDATGSLARLSAEGVPGRTLRIPVPVGTVVKKKRGGKLLADLARPGDEVVVAKGGRGGVCVYELPPSKGGRELANLSLPAGVPVMKGWEDRELLNGQPGEEVGLELILRVVADVGLVGLPNAGKSSLLAALTAARPAVAAYPFTTLIPNLGKMAGDAATAVDGGYAKSGPTLADLPGLIRGAHRGKGLGRMFLRHLRRTRLLVHLVDASAPEPAQDYADLREELRLYNPEYTQRPHVVVLNKIDLPEAAARKDELVRALLAVSRGSRNSSDSSAFGREDAQRHGSETSTWSAEGEGEVQGYTSSGGEEELGREAVADFQRWEASRHSATGDLGDSDETFGASWSEGASGSEAGTPRDGGEGRTGAQGRQRFPEEQEDLWGEGAGGGEAWGSQGIQSRLMPLPLLDDQVEGEGGTGRGWDREDEEGKGKEGGEDVSGEGTGDEAESVPLAIVAISAKEGEGVEELIKVINWAMHEARAVEAAKLRTHERRGGGGANGAGKRLKAPQWQL